MPATFEHVEKARQIGVGIGVRIDQGMAHPGLRREMHDMGEAVDCKRFRHRPAVGDVDPFEPKVGECLELRDAGLLDARIVVGIEIIDTHDIVPVQQQAPRNVHSDESGRAGDPPSKYKSFRVAYKTSQKPTVSLHAITACNELRIGQLKPLPQRRTRPPSHFKELATVKEFARRTVGTRPVRRRVCPCNQRPRRRAWRNPR